jgi:hypothetical protein
MASALPAKKSRRKRSRGRLGLVPFWEKSDETGELWRNTVNLPRRNLSETRSGGWNVGRALTATLFYRFPSFPADRQALPGSAAESRFDASTSSAAKNPRRPKTARTIHRWPCKYSVKHSSFRTPRDIRGPSCRRGVRRMSGPLSSICPAVRANP